MQGWQRTAAGPVRAEVTHEPGAAAGLSLLAGDLAAFSASVLLMNLVVPRLHWLLPETQADS